MRNVGEFRGGTPFFGVCQRNGQSLNLAGVRILYDLYDI